MGKFIWHEHARYVSITATVCKLATQSLCLKSHPKEKKTPSGPPTLGWFIVNSFGTLLVVSGATLEAYSMCSIPPHSACPLNPSFLSQTSESGCVLYHHHGQTPSHSDIILHPRTRHSRVRVSRAIYERHCCISKLGRKGCTVGFPSFLRYIVLPGAFSRPIRFVADDQDRSLVRGQMGQCGLLLPSVVTHAP